MATTATISRSVNPAVNLPRRLTLSLDARSGYIGGGPGSALLSVSAERNDLIGAAFSGRAIDVSLAPRIIRHGAALQIRAVPRRQSWCRLDECGQALRRGRVAARIQIEQIKRAREALDLDFGGFDLRFTEVAEHPRADQRHDDADDGYDDQHFHE